MNNEINTGGAAFPFGQTDYESGQLCNGWGSEGMTLRDYFAAAAITALMTPNPVTGQYHYVEDFPECASVAYVMADAMIKARSNK